VIVGTLNAWKLFQAMFQSAGDVTVSANVSTAGKTQIHG
jgi:hypothetical protein